MEYSKLVEFSQRFRGPILVKKLVEGVKPRKNLKKIPQNEIQRKIDVSRDSLYNDFWLEVEKSEFVQVCVNSSVIAWETSLESNIDNDSCLAFQAPTIVGVDTLKVYFSDANYSRKIHLAVGKKFLNFKKEKVQFGYDDAKPHQENSLDRYRITFF